MPKPTAAPPVPASPALRFWVPYGIRTLRNTAAVIGAGIAAIMAPTITAVLAAAVFVGGLAVAIRFHGTPGGLMSPADARIYVVAAFLTLVLALVTLAVTPA